MNHGHFGSEPRPETLDQVVLRNVGMPNSYITMIWAPIFEWYAVKCGSRNRHHKDMYSKENGLHDRNLLTIVGSIVKRIEGTCMN